MRLEYLADANMFTRGEDFVDPGDAAKMIDEMQDKIESLEENLLHSSYSLPAIVEQRDKLLDRVDQLEKMLGMEK